MHERDKTRMKNMTEVVSFGEKTRKVQNTELLKTNENLRAKLQQLNHKINRSKDDLDLDR